MTETFLVTGSFGCIGAWVLRALMDEGVRIIATDLADDPVRPQLLLNEKELREIDFQQLDVTDLNAVQEMVGRKKVTHVIHLAGLQVPFCRANPALGASVNVLGTVNLFEAVKAHWGQVQGIAYASSLAVLGTPDKYPERPVLDDVRLHPDTLYGVYKQANEHTARIYWQDYGIPSIGLRPYIVYGVARDQGMTSDIAKAILAAVAHRPFHINFDGPCALQLAEDVARMFIECARADFQGAAACNLRNDVVTVQEFVAALQVRFPNAEITYPDGNLLPFPEDLDDSGLRRIIGSIPHTPLTAGIADTAARFQQLLAEKRLDLSQLEPA